MTAPDTTHLVEQFMSLAFSIARRWAKAYPGLRDDFRSDAAYALWDAATRFTPRYPDDPTRGFPAFARTIIRFALLARLRLSRRTVPSIDLNLDPEGRGIADLAVAHTANLDAGLDAPVLLAVLSPARRQVVEMRLAGASFPEIAEARHVTYEAVRSMFDRAVRQMQDG